LIFIASSIFLLCMEVSLAAAPCFVEPRSGGLAA
jgi:hypothetical protein